MEHKDFFISYNKNDTDWATWIASILEGNNYSVYLQHWDIRPGDDFIDKMDAFLKHTTKFMPILSSTYMDSPYCKAEWNPALAAAISNKGASFIPVRVSDISPEGLLKTRVYIDLVGLDEDNATHSLLSGLNPIERKHSGGFPGSKKKIEKTVEENAPYPATIIKGRGDGTMFKWVHISDLHFHSTDGVNAAKIKEKLPVILKGISDVDALFITGDFRYAKSNNTETATPIAYISTLCAELHLPLEQVYCVPGNHDLDRSRPRQYIVDGVVGVNGKIGDYVSDQGTIDPQSLNELIKGFGYFADIERGLYKTCLLGDGNNGNIHRLVKTPQCNIVLLNTAITSASDNDRQSLLLGTNYLRKALDEIDETKPTIMLGHHGHSFFEREEAKAIQPLLSEKKVHLYLCGHEHDLVKESVWDNIQQFSAGCIWADGSVNIAKAGFYVGEISADFQATVTSYEWRKEDLEWRKNKTFPPFLLLDQPTPGTSTENNLELQTILDETDPFSINFGLDGHILLGARGKEGIKYFWQKDGDRVESLAFNKRQSEPHSDPEIRVRDENISAYTTSTSLGCILRESNKHCRFCETGTRDFRGILSAEEIALQNIFMATYDSNCPSFPEVRDHSREFAFMGQGEPGFSYPQIRKAILLTDCAMELIKQKIYRYVISTCGIPDFGDLLIEDVKRGVFKNRISLHFSLHAVGADRKAIMPIDSDFRYERFIKICEKFYRTAKDTFGGEEKIGVGVLAFKDFLPSLYPNTGTEAVSPITLTQKKVKAILDELNPEVFRIDLSEFNIAPTATKSSHKMSNEDTTKLRNYIESRGFEVKLFSSFGIGKDAECGLLRSSNFGVEPDGATTLIKLEEAKKILAYAIDKIDVCE